MKLTVEHDRETLKRYRHTRPARGWGVRRCGARCPGSARTCTLEAGHRGPHISHGLFGKVVAVWDSEGMGVTASVARLRTTLATGTGGRLRKKSTEGTAAAIWHRVAGAMDSLPEIAFLTFLAVFLGAVAYWLYALFRVSS